MAFRPLFSFERLFEAKPARSREDVQTSVTTRAFGALRDGAALTNFIAYYKFEITVSAEIIRGGGCGVEGLIDAAFA